MTRTGRIRLAVLGLACLAAGVGATAQAQSLPVRLDFDGNRVLPQEVYRSVLRLAARSSTVPEDLANNAAWVEAQLTAFLRGSGYLLATVDAKPDVDGGLMVFIDEGHIDRLIVLGQGIVDTLDVQLNVEVPRSVFNKYDVERQLDALVRRRGFEEARYEVVPMAKVDHPGIQLPVDTVFGTDISPIYPGEPHELRVYLTKPEWRTGLGAGVGFQRPDGFFVSGKYRAASLLTQDDRLRIEGQVAVRLLEAAFSSNRNIGVSRVTSINRWYAPPLFGKAIRPTVELELGFQNRFRRDLGIDSYLFAPFSGALTMELEATPGLTFALGGGVQYRSLAGVEPLPGVVLEVPPTERTVRVFGQLDVEWWLRPNQLRRDRRDRLRFKSKYLTSANQGFGGFGLLSVKADKVFTFGYDEIWIEYDGAIMLGDVPFTDEMALGDGFIRAGFSGDFFTRKATSISAEYRLSLNREAFKISVFNDAAIFEELRANRTSERLQFVDNVGLGLHFLILNSFQVNVYAGAGFVPRLAPRPGVSVQVKQAF